jgi:hypothetical protein
MIREESILEVATLSRCNRRKMWDLEAGRDLEWQKMLAKGVKLRVTVVPTRNCG